MTYQAQVTADPSGHQRKSSDPMPDSKKDASRRTTSSNTRGSSSLFSFEKIVKNKSPSVSSSLPSPHMPSADPSAQPCSLNDFMDYLSYVEHAAENLQFFLWYCDYVQRWSKLSPREKAMSPVWDPEKHTTHRLPRASIHRRGDSEKLTKILTIMEPKSKKTDKKPVSERPSMPEPESPCAAETQDWQHCTSPSLCITSLV
jgi:hypothetical protein